MMLAEFHVLEDLDSDSRAVPAARPAAAARTSVCRGPHSNSLDRDQSANVGGVFGPGSFITVLDLVEAGEEVSICCR
jgi:hypothetical protein